MVNTDALPTTSCAQVHCYKRSLEGLIFLSVSWIDKIATVLLTNLRCRLQGDSSCWYDAKFSPLARSRPISNAALTSTSTGHLLLFEDGFHVCTIGVMIVRLYSFISILKLRKKEVYTCAFQ